MSLGLLLEKYDVSTEEGLQKALSEIEKEEVPNYLLFILTYAVYINFVQNLLIFFSLKWTKHYLGFSQEHVL